MAKTNPDIVFFRCDPDTLAELRARAMRHGTSLAEEVRTLLEWALEDHPLDNDDPLSKVSAEMHLGQGG